ncbi:hypothetical protein ACFSTH_19840 [Paenibacillus yanchengensis]|uniref:DUF2007 domain-containing protein n=1 Tax=Paenibacillus yanchengensis TaxID=2035833 RepID=A0ABW4YN40_9BACL
MGWFGGKWVTIRTASGSKLDEAERLYALLKSNGIKAKVVEDGVLRKVNVKAKDEQAARTLAQTLEKER